MDEGESEVKLASEQSCLLQRFQAATRPVRQKPAADEYSVGERCLM